MHDLQVVALVKIKNAKPPRVIIAPDGRILALPHSG